MAMSFLSMMEAKLPPGFRFHPRDEELITDYLVKKITGDSSSGGNYFPLMEVVDLNKVEPWELPGTACVGGKEWYFYSLRDRKYATGQRTNRATISGYWKATGKDRDVSDGRRGGELVGMRKTLVFYQGRAPKGKKTEWVMHEFRMEGRSQHHHIPNQNPTSASSSSSSSSSNSNPFKEDWVLCRVFYKGRGLSPKSTTSNGSNMSSYGDTISSSSSFPPLMDTHINFEQPHLITQNNNNGYNNDQWKNDQVPCFSNLQFHHQLPPPPLLPPPLIETKNMYSSSSSSAAQLGTCHMPDMTSLLHPLVNFPSDKKAVKAILYHLSTEVDWRSAASLAESSEIFKAETDEHDSLWNSF